MFDWFCRSHNSSPTSLEISTLPLLSLYFPFAPPTRAKDGSKVRLYTMIVHVYLYLYILHNQHLVLIDSHISTCGDFRCRVKRQRKCNVASVTSMFSSTQSLASRCFFLLAILSCYHVPCVQWRCDGFLVWICMFNRKLVHRTNEQTSNYIHEQEAEKFNACRLWRSSWPFTLQMIVFPTTTERRGLPCQQICPRRSFTDDIIKLAFHEHQDSR